MGQNTRTSRGTSKRAVPVAVALALFLLAPALLHAQSITVEKGKIEITQGKIESKGDVTVAGIAPSLVLGDNATLTLAEGKTLTIGDGGTLTASASSPTSPALITSEDPGNKFYALIIDNNGTLNATLPLTIHSVDTSGVQLLDGSGITNNTLDGVTFDSFASGGTYLQFNHTTGMFTVKNSQFLSANSLSTNIATLTGFTGNVDASLGNSGYWATGNPSTHENDHGAGTDETSTSTIQWPETTPRIYALRSTSPDGNYFGNDLINVTIDFTKPVTLETGGEMIVQLDSGGQAILTPFIDLASPAEDYFVLFGEITSDLTATGITLPTGTLQDATGNDADLAIPSGKNIGDSSNIVLLDGPNPTNAVVNDGPAVDIDYQSSTNFIQANWAGFVDEDPIDHYVVTFQDSVGNTIPGTTPLTLSGTTFSASVNNVTLTPGQQYFVKVEAWDSQSGFATKTSDGVWIDNQAPPIPTLESPTDGFDFTGTSGFTFQWSDVTDPQGSPVTYQLQIATDSNFDNLLLNASTSTSELTTGSLPAGSYYWKVLARDEAGNESAFTTHWSFTVSGTGGIFLGVNNGANSFWSSNERNDATGLALLQIHLQAASVGTPRIHSLTLSAGGTVQDATDIGAVSLYLDVDRNGLFDLGRDILLSGPLTFSSDNGTVTFSGLNRDIPQGLSRDWIAVVDLNGNGTPGKTLSLQVDTIGAINAESSVSSFTGRTIQIVEPEADGAVTLTPGTGTLPDGFVGKSENNVEILQLQLNTSSLEEVTATQLEVTATGTGNDAGDVTQVTLVVDSDGNGLYHPAKDGPVLSTGSFSSNDGSATLTFNRTLPRGMGEKWLVLYNLNGTENTTFSLSVSSATLVATGLVSGATLIPGGSNAIGNTQTIEQDNGTDEGRLTVTYVPTEVPAYLVPPVTNIQMIAMDLTAGGTEAIDVTELRIRSMGSGNETNGIPLLSLWEDDGDGKFDELDDTRLKVIPDPFDQNNGTVLLTGLQYQIPAGATRRWFVTYDFDNKAPLGTSYQAWFDLLDSPEPITAFRGNSFTAISTDGDLIAGGILTLQKFPSSGGGSGCGCVAPGEPSGPPALPLIALLILFAFRRNR